MLANSRLQTIVWTARTSEAERFYSDLLGLPLIGRSHGAMRYNVGGGELRVLPVPATTPTAHTVLGFSVSNVDVVCEHLVNRDISMQRFAG